MHWSVAGHEEQRKYLERLLDEGRLPHALLLAGPSGVGKGMMAEDIAAALVPPGYSPDLMRIAPEKDEDGEMHGIPIEAVREMKKWISLRPLGLHKVVLVDDADRLGLDAGNTLLKVLEEPPAYARLMLVSGKPEHILGTIRSRCERVDFRALEDSDVAALLKSSKLDADDRALLAAVTGGRPGAALRLVHEKKLPTVAHHIAGLEKALKGGITERIIYAKDVADDDTPAIVAWWLAYVHGQLPRRPELAAVAHGLVELHGVVSEPFFNRRLAIEHFLLSV